MSEPEPAPWCQEIPLIKEGHHRMSKGMDSKINLCTFAKSDSGLEIQNWPDPSLLQNFKQVGMNPQNLFRARARGYNALKKQVLHSHRNLEGKDSSGG